MPRSSGDVMPHIGKLPIRREAYNRVESGLARSFSPVHGALRLEERGKAACDAYSDRRLLHATFVILYTAIRLSDRPLRTHLGGRSCSAASASASLDFVAPMMELPVGRDGHRHLSVLHGLTPRTSGLPPTTLVLHVIHTSIAVQTALQSLSRSTYVHITQFLVSRLHGSSPCHRPRATPHSMYPQSTTTPEAALRQLCFKVML